MCHPGQEKCEGREKGVYDHVEGVCCRGRLQACGLGIALFCSNDQQRRYHGWDGGCVQSSCDSSSEPQVYPPLPPHTVCCLPTMATSVSYTHGFRVLVGSFLYFGLIPRWDPALLAVGVMTADFYRYSLSLTVGVFAAIDPIISYLRPLGSTRSQFYSFHVQ